MQFNQKVRLLTKFKNCLRNGQVTLLFESSTLGPSNMMVAQIVKLMQISMRKMRKTLSCQQITGFLVGTLLITGSASKNSGADEVPIKWGDFELGGDQLVVDCIDSSGSFCLYSKMLRGGKVFLIPKKLVNIRSEPPLFFYIAVPKIGEVVDSDPNNYLAVV